MTEKQKSDLEVQAKEVEQLVNELEETIDLSKVPVGTFSLHLLMNGDIEYDCEFLDKTSDIATMYGHFLYHIVIPRHPL